MSEITTTTKVVKPFKLIALILLIIGLILLIVGIASPDWLDTDGYKQGLWRECRWTEDSPEECTTLKGEAWVKACGAMCIMALLCILSSIVMTSLGLCSKSYNFKHLIYKVATIVTIIAVLLMLVGLIVFPIMFLQKIVERQKTIWLFQWAYGVAWGATIFVLGATVMLCLDQESYRRDFVNKQ